MQYVSKRYRIDIVSATYFSVGPLMREGRPPAADRSTSRPRCHGNASPGWLCCCVKLRSLHWRLKSPYRVNFDSSTASLDSYDLKLLKASPHFSLWQQNVGRETVDIRSSSIMLAAALLSGSDWFPTLFLDVLGTACSMQHSMQYPARVSRLFASARPGEVR